MRSSKNRSKIILAVVAALLATFISYSSFNNMNGQISEQQKLIELMQKTQSDDYKGEYAYAVANYDLKAGEIVSDGDVDFKNFENIDTTAFENRSDVVNKVMLQDIKAGETFTGAHIAKISSDDLSLKEGYRALTLPSDKFQGRAASMLPGAYIDIYSSTDDSGWVIENVRIISAEGADSVTGTSVGLDKASAITFEVPVEGISDFISNASKGGLVLVARSAKDKKVYHKKSSSKKSGGHTSFASLTNLPEAPPIGDYSGSGLSGLPLPSAPSIYSESVELIEANVKSKVTFD